MMQLHDVPILGGLTPDEPVSRREQLARDGAEAQREVAALLGRARSRARMQLISQGFLLTAAGLLVALLAGTLIASFNGAVLARVVAAVLAGASAVAAVLFSVRRGLTPKALARALGGPSELLSSVEFTADPPAGASLELLSLLHVRAEESARKIDLREALPAKILRVPLLALAGALALWGILV